MAADADVRPPGPESGESADGSSPVVVETDGPAAVEADGPVVTVDGAGDRVVVRIDLDAEALAHLEAGEPLDPDAARELAAVLDGHAAARE